jgi:hypothetical protein
MRLAWIMILMLCVNRTSTLPLEEACPNHKQVVVTTDIAVIDIVAVEKIINTTLPIVKQIESNNNSNEVGDGGKAFGILQIHKICVQDVNRLYGTSYTHNQMFDVSMAEIIYKLYLTKGIEIYVEKHCKMPNTMEVVRMWNGGIYNGYTKTATIDYADRYRKYNRQE